MIYGQRSPAAFTLIEIMLSVLLMALLAGAVAMRFSQPLNAARAGDAIQLIHSFDTTGRQMAAASDRNVRLVFDLEKSLLVQRDGGDLQQLRTRVTLPQGCRMDAVKIDDHLISAGEVAVDLSSHGWSKTYAVHLEGAGIDCWLVFAGMSGQMTQVKNESQIPIYDPPSRHHAD